jgi:hypothetical protein
MGANMIKFLCKLKINMQAIKSRKISRKKILLVVLALVVLTTGSGVFAYTQKIGPFSEVVTQQTGQEINFNEPTEDQIEAGEETKEAAVNDQSKPATTTPSSSGVANPAPGKEVVVEITGRNRTGSTLTVKTLIQEVNASGTCTLTLTKAGQKTITKIAKVQALPSSSTCEGFTVEGLTSGEWNLKIDYKSATSSGSVSEKV